MSIAPDDPRQPRHEVCFRCSARNAQHVLILAATDRIGDLRWYLRSIHAANFMKQFMSIWLIYLGRKSHARQWPITRHGANVTARHCPL